MTAIVKIDQNASNEFYKGVLCTSEKRKHEHIPIPTARQAAAKRQHIREHVNDEPRSKATKVLANIRSNVTDEVFVQMGSDEALSKLIQRFTYLNLIKFI